MNQKPISRLDINIAIYNFKNKKRKNGLSAEDAELINKLQSVQAYSSDTDHVSDAEIEMYHVISK